MRSRAMKTFLGILGGVALSVVPASVYANTILDLTTAGATEDGTAAVGGTFIVQQVPDQSTGTGVIDSFVRIQNNVNESGYNTDLAPQLDTKAGTFTHSITLGEVPLVALADGNVYYQFLLDINQNTGGTNEFLSLTQIQIFTAASDQLHTGLTDATATTASAIQFAGATERFRMSSTSSNQFNEIQLNYALNGGSGSGDMYLYVLKSAFGAVSSTSNVILYSQFGTPPGAYSTNDGFEEWALLKGVTTCTGTGCDVTVTPEPASLMLLGSGLAMAAVRFRKNRKAVRQA